MSILITGGCGAIGSLLVRRLVEQGKDNVIVLDQRPDFQLLQDLSNDFQFISGNILDLGELVNTLQEHRVQRVVHMAAVILPSTRPFTVIDVNITGTANILEAARLTGVKRTVLCSNRGVYGPTRGRHAAPEYEPINEDYPHMLPEGNNTLYNASKQFCEHLAVHYQRRYGLDIIALRFASTYGYGKGERHGALAILPRMIENAAGNLPTIIPQGGDQYNDFIYNRDVAQALDRAAYIPEHRHLFYHIGSGKKLSLHDFAHILKQRFPEAIIEIGPGPDYLGNGFEKYAVFDIGRAREDLGYQPEYTPEAAIDDYLQLFARFPRR